MNNELINLIDIYGRDKEELKKLTDSTKKINTKIKAEMAEMFKNDGRKEYSGNKYKVSYSVRKKESMNEEKLLDIAHENGLTELIKTREYIDYDALENALYNNLIAPEIVKQIASTKEVKEEAVLRVSEV